PTSPIYTLSLHDALPIYAIVGFYDEVTSDMDSEFGATAVTMIFPEFPLLKKRIQICQDLISEAREEYDKRTANYMALRNTHIPRSEEHTSELQSPCNLVC